MMDIDPDQPVVVFPPPPDQTAADAWKRRQAEHQERELQKRIDTLLEVSRVLTHRGMMREVLAIKHAGFWLGGWEAERAERLLIVASIVALPEFRSLVSTDPRLRALFMQDMPPPPPRRQRQPDYRRKRNRGKRESFDPFDVPTPTLEEMLNGIPGG